MPRPIPRDEAWTLLTEWVAAAPLRRHCLAVEAAMRAYAARDGADDELWGVTGLLHDADYERFPDIDAPATRARSWPSSSAATRRRRWSARSPPTPTTSASRATRRWSGRCTPSTSCRGFIVACAMVRPEGIVGLTPKSVRKKLKQPSFAAAVNRDELQSAADELGVPFDEHVAFVIAALRAAAPRRSAITGRAPR